HKVEDAGAERRLVDRTLHDMRARLSATAQVGEVHRLREVHTDDLSAGLRQAVAVPTLAAAGVETELPAESGPFRYTRAQTVPPVGEKLRIHPRCKELGARIAVKGQRSGNFIPGAAGRKRNI